MTAAFLNEQPQDVWARIMRTAKLLLLLAAVVFIDSFNRMSLLIDSYDQLRGALYDFTVKYKEPFTEWYQNSAQAAKTPDVVIRFEKYTADSG